MSNKKKVIEKNERKVKVMDWKKKEIDLIRLESGIHEEYKPDTYGPVYVHYLPNGCSIKGATMFRRLSSVDILLADQVAMESEAALQMQSMRILRYPFKTERNVIVLDSLETGILSIYEPIAKHPLSVEYSSDGCIIRGATLVGEISTINMLEDKRVIAKGFFCKEGYEELAESMINQVQNFIKFYVEI